MFFFFVMIFFFFNFFFFWNYNIVNLWFFESGFDSITNVQISFSLHFFFIMLVFVLFDLEFLLFMGILFCDISSFFIMFILLFFVFLSFFFEWFFGKIFWVF